MPRKNSVTSVNERLNRYKRKCRMRSELAKAERLAARPAPRGWSKP